MERALCLLMGKFPEHVDRRDFYELREMQYPGDIGIPDLLPDTQAGYPGSRNDTRCRRLRHQSGTQGLLSWSPESEAAEGSMLSTSGNSSLAPASLAYEIAAGLTSPVFNAGQIRNEYSNAIVRRNIVVNSYKETVVRAYSEVAGLIESNENIMKRISVKKRRNADR